MIMIKHPQKYMVFPYYFNCLTMHGATYINTHVAIHTGLPDERNYKEPIKRNR